MIEVFGRGGALKSELVRRLPAQPRLPDAGRPLPAGPLRPRRASSPRRSASATSRRRSRRWSAARCCAPWWCSDGRAGREGRRPRAPSRSTAASGRSTTTSGWSATTTRCWSIDAAHDAEAILAAVGDRRVVAVVCTHGHNDHINAAVEVAAATDAEIALHPADRMLWEQEYGDLHPDIELADGGSFEVGGTRLAVLHTPGHSPGGVCLYAEDLGARVLRRHPVPRRSRRHRPLVQRLRPRSSTRSATGCCPCRRPPSCTPATARTRSSPGGAAPGRVGGPWPLTTPERPTEHLFHLALGRGLGAGAAGRRLPGVDAGPDAGAGGLHPRVLRPPAAGRAGRVLRRGHRAARAARDRPRPARRAGGRGGAGGRRPGVPARLRADPRHAVVSARPA